MEPQNVPIEIVIVEGAALSFFCATALLLASFG
jgi:hypothetical protein